MRGMSGIGGTRMGVGGIMGKGKGMNPLGSMGCMGMDTIMGGKCNGKWKAAMWNTMPVGCQLGDASCCRALCSIHNKTRSADCLEDAGDGILRCKLGSECKSGS